MIEGLESICGLETLAGSVGAASFDGGDGLDVMGKSAWTAPAEKAVWDALGKMSTEAKRAALVGMYGFGDMEARILADADAATWSEFFGASNDDQVAYLEQRSYDPKYTMTPAEYERYVAGQRSRQAAVSEAEKLKLKDLAERRAKDPELAKSVDPYGGVTEYGAGKAAGEREAAKAKAALAAQAGKIPPWAWLAGAGVVGFLVLRKRGA